MTDTTFKSSFPRKNVTPYPDTGPESIFGHCRQPSDLGGTNTHFHPSVCRRQGCMDDSSENSLCDVSIRHSGGGRNPVSGLCWPLSFSCLVVSVATDMGDCYGNSHRATPTPSFLRKQESILGAPAINHLTTGRPTPFSIQVVRVATLMRNLKSLSSSAGT